MALPVKGSLVRIRIISDRRPDSETADIACERAIRSQNTGVHGDVVHKNCICRRILRRAVSKCSVDKSGKPIKLSGIGDFVNCILFSVAVDVMLISCQRCRLITAALCTESVRV